MSQHKRNCARRHPIVIPFARISAKNYFEVFRMRDRGLFPSCNRVVLPIRAVKSARSTRRISMSSQSEMMRRPASRWAYADSEIAHPLAPSRATMSRRPIFLTWRNSRSLSPKIFFFPPDSPPEILDDTKLRLHFFRASRLRLG